MSDIININDFRKEPHITHEVICVKCCSQWIAVAPERLLLKNYECKNCGKGFVIKTGQALDV